MVFRNNSSHNRDLRKMIVKGNKYVMVSLFSLHFHQGRFDLYLNFSFVNLCIVGVDFFLSPLKVLCLLVHTPFPTFFITLENLFEHKTLSLSLFHALILLARLFLNVHCFERKIFPLVDISNDYSSKFIAITVCSMKNVKKKTNIIE